MVFSSITFLFYFLPVSIGAYYMAPDRFKNMILLVVSLFFYAWGEPVYILLMIFSVLMNYAAGILLDRKKKGARKAVLMGAVFCNLLLLGFFKYADFFLLNFSALIGINLKPLALPLPIGISFYTFQALSYVIDLYRGNVRPQRNLINFAMYISMFPQLIAGPIVRLSDVEDKLIRRDCSSALFAEGVRRFTAGLGKKVLLANNAGILWDTVNRISPDELSCMTAWLGILGFTFQIYFDFSGYSDMAIGLGKMFGFDFPENFRYPYASRSVTEFWRRWHISLGTWFREYVYIPLGGNRRGSVRHLGNILTVWLLTGLWHGAGMNFLLWGFYFAVILMAEKLFLLKVLSRWPKIIGHLYTMVLVVFSWVFFALDSLETVGSYLCTMFGMSAAGLWDGQAFYLAGSNFGLLLILAFGATEFPSRLYHKCTEFLRAAGSTQKEEGLQGSCRRYIAGIIGILLENVGLAAVLLLSIAYVAASTYNPFLYFRF